MPLNLRVKVDEVITFIEFWGRCLNIVSQQVEGQVRQAWKSCAHHLPRLPAIEEMYHVL